MSKTTKDAVHYQAKPHGHQACAKCSMFRTPRACTHVEGYISPRGWCEDFRSKRLVEALSRS